MPGAEWHAYEVPGHGPFATHAGHGLSAARPDGRTASAGTCAPSPPTRTTSPLREDLRTLASALA